jgi:hypothetical protein
MDKIQTAQIAEYKLKLLGILEIGICCGHALLLIFVSGWKIFFSRRRFGRPWMKLPCHNAYEAAFPAASGYMNREAS